MGFWGDLSEPDPAQVYADQDAVSWTRGWNDYRAATTDMEPDQRPPYDPGEWTAGGEPTHAAWACQGCPEHGGMEQAGQPLCPSCVQADCPGAYGGSCAYQVASYDMPSQDGHRYGSPCPDPHCRGECGG